MKEFRYSIRLKKLLNDWPVKLFSVIVATLIWSWVQSAELTNSTAQIPLRVKLPENLLPMQAIPKSIFVEVSGPKGRIHQFERAELFANYDLQAGVEGANAIDLLMVSIENLPNGVNKVRTTPSGVEIVLDKPMTKELIVEPNLVGIPDSTVELHKQTVTPASVTIRGPRQLLKTIDNVTTKAIPIDGLTENTSFNVPVALGSDLLYMVGSRNISVQVDLRQALISRTLSCELKLPQWEVSPSKLSISVEGNKAVVSAITADDFQLSTDLFPAPEASNEVRTIDSRSLPRLKLVPRASLKGPLLKLWKQHKDSIKIIDIQSNQLVMQPMNPTE